MGFYFFFFLLFDFFQFSFDFLTRSFPKRSINLHITLLSAANISSTPGAVAAVFDSVSISISYS